MSQNEECLHGANSKFLVPDRLAIFYHRSASVRAECCVSFGWWDMTYPNTFYSAEVDAGPLLDPLTKHLQADVCIIGGGLAGLTTGLELSRRGLGVVLLEAERVGWGASGRNAGFVSAGFALEGEKLFQTVGKDDAWTV